VPVALYIQEGEVVFKLIIILKTDAPLRFELVLKSFGQLLRFHVIQGVIVDHIAALSRGGFVG